MHWQHPSWYAEHTQGTDDKEADTRAAGKFEVSRGGWHGWYSVLIVDMVAYGSRWLAWLHTPSIVIVHWIHIQFVGLSYVPRAVRNTNLWLGGLLRRHG